MKIFIIEPGHGGNDPGAAGNSLQEKDLTLDISKRIAEILQSQYSDIKPMLTRDTDKSMTLSERTSWANKQGAVGLVSVHINSAASPDANGFETLPNDDR
ncbi:N-acetylmuramoyl-L-alanine amidase [Paenibacillus mesophilus]|nr:N-acetylmuramoyl-L-alanine amidase [Paenibacillus mesophilus]TMV43150.1 N-acetylmuramoyl-L-alanine amidase [Paenibacillus mesophilus]